MTSHFHRPPPFQFPRGPPSPPDTNTETIVPGMPVPTMPSNLSLSGHEFDSGLATSSPDFSGSRIRKSSSIPYHPSGLRDIKDRPTSNHQRSTKSLIIVIPPSTLLNEGEQSQALYNEPYHRLAQGIIMPLFPSMFGQLTAIAREFNFPSTSGINLYFHFVEGEFTLTPRISDDSWPTLWSHLSESSERRPLISGKIEFDIDHRLARWYGPWVSSVHREASEASQSHPHTAPYGHFRGESRTTTDGRFFDEDMGESSAIQQHSAPIRHAPRKLSLVERFESPTVRADRRAPLSLGTSPEILPPASHTLSPIRQEDEPKSARQDLNNRVKSWRASAQLSPTPLAATGQTSLEPPNLPNTMVLNIASEPEVEENSMNMDDFEWSISSAGPQSEGALSPLSWEHAPSVHLDSRLMGSVCSTPSIQTSSGPSDYDPFSPGPAQFPRIPSPDIAQRFYEDAPNTPLTATSWGAPLSYPPSPVLFSRVPSPDIGHRYYECAPDTPMTATSWGAPLSYPSSPICLSPAPSLDLGERATFDDVEASFHFPSLVDSSTYIPSTSTPWYHVWPYTGQERPRTESDARSSVSADRQEVAEDGLVWRQVWPYNSHSISVAINALPKAQPQLVYQPSFVYPFTNIYRPVYPYFDIYPALQKSVDDASSERATTVQTAQDDELDAGYPKSDIYADVYPHNLGKIYPTISRQASAIAGAYDYPRNLSNIYPKITSFQGEIVQDANVYEYLWLQAVRPGQHNDYPHNLSVIYPPILDDTEGYPYNLDHIYASAKLTRADGVNAEAYPFFNLYPPMTSPFFAHLSLHLCGPQSQYPTFEIYPEIPRRAIGHLAADSKPTISSAPTYAVSGTTYPIFNLYPAVYPFFDLYPSLDTIYRMPTIPVETSLNDASSVKTSEWKYPSFNLYPAVYPYFDLYPATAVRVDHHERKIVDSPVETRSTITISASYPFFDLYPGVYPFLQIYPSAYDLATRESINNVPACADKELILTPTLKTMYPSFNLYPSVYPYLDIYPAAYGSRKVYSTSSVSNEDGRQLLAAMVAAYPSFVLYPSVYPYFDLYPAPYFEDDTFKAMTNTSQNPESVAVQSNSRYPIFNLYPAVYPYFNIYPSLPSMSPPSSRVAPTKSAISIPTKFSSRLTHAELHAMVMMEKVGSTGSFGHMEHGSNLSESDIQVQAARANSLNDPSHSAKLRNFGAPARNIHGSSSSQTYRVSMAFKAGAYSMSQDQSSQSESQRTAPEFNSSPISRSSSLRREQPDVPLPPRSSVAQRRDTISRSNSHRDQIHTSSPSIGLPSRPAPPRKRDSIVLQRVKAYDSTGEYGPYLSLADKSDNDEISRSHG